MINVVFLLLIFFLMTASLTPPPPLDIRAPVTEAPQVEAQPGTLYVAADGTLVFAGATGEAALLALADAPRDNALPVLADAAYPAADIARLLPRLAALGISEIHLIVVQP